MRPFPLLLAALLALAPLALGGCRTAQGYSVQEKRDFALAMQRQALADLYRERPEARSHVERAPGYAAFSSVGSKILVVATGNGFGVATNNETGENTFMRMVEAGGGVGMGIKSYRAVFVFNTPSAFRIFERGEWQIGGDADAGAQYDEKGATIGGAVTSDEMSRPVTVYQFTDKGVALAAGATGTRFYRDDSLN